MSGVHLQDITMLHLLWVLPALAALYVYASRRRRRSLELFVDAGLLDRIPVSASTARRRVKAGLVILATGLIVAALTRPAWNPVPKTVQRRGRDVVFLLDVSNSMLDEDLAPNRLERAKLAIGDCIARLQGDRVGLVVFAGTAVVKCPLTLDYGFFQMMLDGVSTGSASRGGTMMGDAIRTALTNAFDDEEKKYKDIVLITDGEDHDSFPVAAAEKAGERGIRLIAIGLGDENEGRRIPITADDGTRTFMKYEGREIWTKLDADVLRQMVNATPEGKYLNVSTGTIDLGDVYARLIDSAEKRELESKTMKRYEEKFQGFLAVAFVLLSLEMLISDRKRERT